jgi:hypothetical protein
MLNKIAFSADAKDLTEAFERIEAGDLQAGKTFLELPFRRLRQSVSAQKQEP